MRNLTSPNLTFLLDYNLPILLVEHGYKVCATPFKAKIWKSRGTSITDLDPKGVYSNKLTSSMWRWLWPLMFDILTLTKQDPVQEESDSIPFTDMDHGFTNISLAHVW